MSRTIAGITTDLEGKELKQMLLDKIDHYRAIIHCHANHINRIKKYLESEDCAL